VPHIDIVIEDRESPQGKPKYVFVSMDDATFGANTWSIDIPNNWIGIGSGEYKVSGFNSDILEFRDGSWRDGKPRMKLFNIKYPDDCKPKPGADIKKGPGSYLSPLHPWGTFKLEWSGRNIVPDTYDSDGDDSIP
jgi:hypothetical protein